MSYFVLLQNADDGLLRLLRPDLLSTREEALEAVSTALRDDPSLRSAGVFLAELDAASPILFVEPAPELPGVAVDRTVGEGEPAAAGGGEYEESSAEGGPASASVVFDYAVYEATTVAIGEAEVPAGPSETEPIVGTPEEPTEAAEFAEQPEALYRGPAEWQYAETEEEPPPVEPEHTPEALDARSVEVGQPSAAWEPTAVEPAMPETLASGVEQEVVEASSTSEAGVKAEPGPAAEPTAAAEAQLLETPYEYTSVASQPLTESELAEEQPVGAVEEQSWMPPLASEQPPPEGFGEDVPSVVDTSWPAETVAEDAEVLAAIASLGSSDQDLGPTEPEEAGPATTLAPEAAEAAPAAWPWTASAEPVEHEAKLAEPVPAEFPFSPPSIEEPWGSGPSGHPEAEAAPHEADVSSPYGAEQPDAVTELPAQEPAPPSPAYEPGGDLDLSGYTCNDCVYVNTCPKVGQLTPQECGSFQWRSS